MYRVKGSGRAHIPRPEKHTAGILRGGERPSRFDPHFQVPEQKPPTDHTQLRQRFQFAAEGRLGGLHNPGPGDHHWLPGPVPQKPPDLQWKPSDRPGHVPEGQRGKIDRTPRTPYIDPTPKIDPLRPAQTWGSYARDYGRIGKRRGRQTEPAVREHGQRT
jgi:hypothetical protein